MNDPLYLAFTTVVNLSITASVALLAVLLLRPALRRAPKSISIALWFAPLFRLLCPISFSSVLSVFALLGQQGAPQPVPMNIGTMAQPQVDLFVPSVSHAVSHALPAATPYASINPMQVYLYLGELVWATGALAMALWGVFSYIQLKCMLRTAASTGDVWRTDHPGAPFLAGLLRPRVYVPEGLTGEPLALILRHEQAHLHHRDPWIKLLWYAALCMHWFNPLVWLAFRLVARDMELHADEAALRSLDPNLRTIYADTLLSLCTPHRSLGSPLAFGESGAAGRIRRVLSYKRPAFWLVVTAVVLTVAAVVALVANPLEKQANQNTGSSAYLTATPSSPGETALETTAPTPTPVGPNLSRFAASTAETMGRKYQLARLSYGKETATRFEFTKVERKQLDLVLTDSMLRSLTFPGVDVDALDSCIRLQIYIDPYQPTELYLYRKDSAACAQSGKGGMYTGLNEDLYQEVDAMTPRIAQIGDMHMMQPNYKKIGSNPTDQLIYSMIQNHYAQSGRPAPPVTWKVLGRYQEKNLTRIFLVAATGDVVAGLNPDGTGLVTNDLTKIDICMLTLREDTPGDAATLKPVQEECRFLAPTKVRDIQPLCKMPDSGITIRGLAQRTMDVWTGIQAKGPNDNKGALTLLLLDNKLTMDAGISDEICYLED